jgi:hypothetical protein
VVVATIAATAGTVISEFLQPRPANQDIATKTNPTEGSTDRRLLRSAGPFGEDVVEHYPNAARAELAAIDAAVTDRERPHGFKRR